MSVKERLKIYAASKHLSISDFCRAIDVSVSYVSSMRRSLAPAKIQSIAQKFPDLNLTWLMTGEGSMLVEAAPPVSLVPIPTLRVVPQCTECLKKDGKIELLTQTVEDLNRRLTDMTNLYNSSRAASLDHHRRRNTG